jgi:hypothetical protein
VNYYEYNEHKGRQPAPRASDLAAFHLEPEDVEVVWAIRDAAEAARNWTPQLMRRQAV